MFYQIVVMALICMEILTIVFFEYLFRVNDAKLNQTGFSLTERYQISDNVRMLELLRPLARFHGGTTCLATFLYILFCRMTQYQPSYPIFEEAINILQLRGILMPVIFMRYERKERAKKETVMKKNSCSNDDYVQRHDAEITRG
ncbi:hypothetical protein PENTCL1PPCAC_15631, partial [Pristionchus entomophagus]